MDPMKAKGIIMIKPSIPTGSSICCSYCWTFAGTNPDFPMMVGNDPEEQRMAGYLLDILGWIRDFDNNENLVCPDCVKKYCFVQILPPESTF